MASSPCYRRDAPLFYGDVMKRPSFQFYPADWLNDIKLQSCSLEAQGLLVNLMCFMHQAKPYGHLIINDSIPLDKDVARLLRLHHKTYHTRLKELLLYGVLCRDKNGSIFCKRMIKDEQLRRVRSDAGKLGGNPLLNQTVKVPVIHSVEDEDEGAKEEESSHSI